MSLVWSVLSQQHTDFEWNPCWIVEVYCQLQVYSAKNLDIVSKQKICNNNNNNNNNNSVLIYYCSSLRTQIAKYKTTKK